MLRQGRADDQYHQDLVAAKMMGRWRSGCPLDLSPDKDDLAIAADPERRNNFTYAGDDQGLRCPIGAHLRRSNPRGCFRAWDLGRTPDGHP
jgi:hypothetical protein